MIQITLPSKKLQVVITKARKKVYIVQTTKRQQFQNYGKTGNI